MKSFLLLLRLLDGVISNMAFPRSLSYLQQIEYLHSRRKHIRAKKIMVMPLETPNQDRTIIQLGFVILEDMLQIDQISENKSRILRSIQDPYSIKSTQVIQFRIKSYLYIDMLLLCMMNNSSDKYVKILVFSFLVKACLIFYQE